MRGSHREPRPWGREAGSSETGSSPQRPSRAACPAERLGQAVRAGAPRSLHRVLVAGDDVRVSDSIGAGAAATGSPLPGGRVSLRERVARLSWLTVGLIGASVALFLLALWVASRAETRDIVGQLPLGVGDHLPSVSLVLAAVVAAAAFFFGLAALHVAAAMRVLARDRRIPPPLSPEMRALRAVLLTPLGPSAVRLVEEPEPPRSRLPDRERLGRCRCG